MRRLTYIPASVLLCSMLIAAGCGGKGGGAGNATVKMVAYDSIVRLTETGKPASLGVGTKGDAGRISTPTANVHAARGEVESVQLVLKSSKRTRVRLTEIELAAADGTKLDSKIKLFQERPLVVRGVSPGGFGARNTDGRDPVMDALQPLSKRDKVEIVPGKPGIVWVDFVIPTNAKPGVYSGILRAKIGSNEKAKMAVNVDVAAALLPPEPTLATSFGIDLRELEKREEVALDTNKGQKLFDRYVNLLAEHRISPTDLDIPTEIGTNEGIEGTAAADRIDLLAARTKGSTIRIPIYATYPFEDPLGKDRKFARLWLRNVAAYLRERGLLERSYLYTVDEPGLSDGPRVQDWVALAAEADPGIRMLLTALPAPAFGTGIDIWSPNINPAFNPAQLRQQLAASGAELWSYPSVSTQFPYPTLFSDDPRPSPRALGWLSYSQHLDGLLYWTVNHWQEVEDPWISGGTFRDEATGAIANGDGVLVYPGRSIGRKSPAPSVRLKQLRDGIEDHMLLTLISTSRSGGARTADLLAIQLAAAPASFESRPRIIAELRDRMLSRASQGVVA